MKPLDKEHIDELATRMAKHLPCTTASIVGAVEKAYADADKEAKEKAAKKPE